LKLIIIAAGRGSRIKSLSKGIPKTLLKINSQRIIDCLLNNCIKTNIRECVVVTGYRNDLIENYLSGLSLDINIEFVYNPDWDKPNGISVLAAKTAIPPNTDFLISMSDHLYGADLLQNVIDSSLEQTTANVGLDFNTENIFDIDDGMKVKVDSHDRKIITAMSKKLTVYDAIDCGVFKCRYDFFGVLEQAKRRNAFSLSDACNLLLAKRKLGGVDIGNSFWLDIDTEDAFQYCIKHSTGFFTPWSSDKIETDNQ